jgi:hypothetical protein
MAIDRHAGTMHYLCRVTNARFIETDLDESRRSAR